MKRIVFANRFLSIYLISLLILLVNPILGKSAQHEIEEDKKGTYSVSPFSIYYVYDRKTIAGKEWVEVGTSSKGPTIGWIEAKYLTDWKQAITVSFTNPANRKRTLLFKEHDDLFDLMESADLIGQSEALRYTIHNGVIPENFPVISIEPSVHIDMKDQFYLLPILDTDEVYLNSGFTSMLLKIASVTLEKGEEDEIEKDKIKKDLIKEAPKSAPEMTDFKMGIVFVIDTTSSMGPYIDRTRKAIKQIYQTIEKAKLLGKVSFGLVAYRDNFDGVPQLEYVTQNFATLKDGEVSSVLLNKIKMVTPATVSSKGFNEDAFSGVLSAIEDQQWKDFDGRHIILITDAGARNGIDSLSKTGMNAEQIRRLALDKEIAISVLHLLTKEGVSNHGSAADQYKALTDFPDVGQLYYPVKAGSLERFGDKADLLAQSLVDQVNKASQGKVVAENSNKNQTESVSNSSAVDSDNQKELDELRKKTLLVGRAMQLAYLGKKKGTEAPRFFEAWAASKDLANPGMNTLNVHVLLTKNQLSDLQESLKNIVNMAKQSLNSTESFFNQLKSAAAVMSRDPSKLGHQGSKKLGDLDLMGEYLDGLPYKSKVLQIDEELWTAWSIGEQQAFIDEIDAKIMLYEKIHDDVDHWIILDDGRVPGDAVFPIALDALP